MELFMNLGDVINIVNSGDLSPLDSMTLSDRVTVSLQTSLLGLGTVFAVLALLWGALVLFRVVFAGIEKKSANAADEAPAAAVPTPVEVVPSAAEVSDDSEVVAAITAAISVMLDKPATSFRVVSFRRSGSR